MKNTKIGHMGSYNDEFKPQQPAVAYSLKDENGCVIAICFDKDEAFAVQEKFFEQGKQYTVEEVQGFQP